MECPDGTDSLKVNVCDVVASTATSKLVVLFSHELKPRNFLNLWKMIFFIFDSLNYYLKDASIVTVCMPVEVVETTNLTYLANGKVTSAKNGAVAADTIFPESSSR